uniref:ribosomal protein S3 n=1 Tax=Hydnora abyssinica TaxID=470280 RepID=UPI0021153C9B|nr:ribosomal protein S3 [Hydnora abyssinica]USN93589.1 ribosomal protein S3 [Hydnora abyssinica]
MATREHPTSTRLVINDNYNSFWFVSKKNYSLNLKEDEKIRNSIIKIFNKIYKSTDIIENIFLEKKINFIKINIKVFTSLKLKNSNINIEERLFETISKILNTNQIKLSLIIKKVEKPYENSKFIIKYIELQLRNKISFTKLTNQILELIETKTDVKGIQIQISGRLYGKDRAFVTWAREGQVPLQTIKSNINYCSKSIKIWCGMLGIKVWIAL